MAKFTLTLEEYKVLNYIKSLVQVEDDALRCRTSILDISSATWLEKDIVEASIENLKEHYALSIDDEGRFVLPDSVYNSLFQTKEKQPEEEKTVSEAEKPFRLNADTVNHPAEDDENLYKDQHIEFSELRGEDALDGEALIEEKVLDALTEDETEQPEEVDSVTLKKEKALEKQRLERKERDERTKEEQLLDIEREQREILEKQSEVVAAPEYEESIDWNMSSASEEIEPYEVGFGYVNSDMELTTHNSNSNNPVYISSGEVIPGYKQEEVIEQGNANDFHINGAHYIDESVKNVYEDQHIDFSDIRGGDLSSTDSLEKISGQDVNVDERDSFASKQVISPDVLMSTLQNGSLLAETNLSKVTETDVTPISDVINDNRGRVSSENNGVILSEGVFVKDDSVNAGFNSYNEPSVDNSVIDPRNPNYQQIFGHKSNIPEATPVVIKELLSSGMTTNFGPQSLDNGKFPESVHQTAYYQDENKQIESFEGVREYNAQAQGTTSNQAVYAAHKVMQEQSEQSFVSHNQQANTIKGGVSGKIDYEMSSNKVGTDITSENHSIGTDDNHFGSNTDRMQTTTDSNMNRKDNVSEANVEIQKNMNVMNFSDIARRTSINSIHSSYAFATEGISGDVTQGERKATIAAAGIGTALLSSAILQMAKLQLENETLAIKVYETAKMQDLDLNFKALGQESPERIKEVLTNATGVTFSDKEINAFIRNKDSIASENAIRKEVMMKLKNDPSFLASPGVKTSNEEIRKHLISDGYDKLSIKARLSVLKEMQKYSQNESVRALDLNCMSKGQIERFMAKNKDSLGPNSKNLLRSAKSLKNKQILENFSDRNRLRRSFARYLSRRNVSKQDLVGSSIKSGSQKALSTYHKIQLTIFTTRTASKILSKGLKSGAFAFKRIASGGFKKIGLDMHSLKGKLPDIRKMKPANIVNTIKLARAGASTVSDSLTLSKSEQEEKEKKEKRDELINRVDGARKSFQKLQSKAVKKETEAAMKNATSGGFKSKVTQKKAIDKASKEASKKVAKETAKKGAESAASKFSLSALATAASSAVSSAAAAIAAISAPVWIVIGIVALVFLLLIMLSGNVKGFMAMVEETAVVAGEAGEFLGNELPNGMINSVADVQKNVILVGANHNHSRDDKPYLEDYLKKLQNLDEKREKDAIDFASARIGTYSPESKGLEPYQKNGKYGQNANILAGHQTQYYGSYEHDKGYTLHYMDAYGNEIANHSTNAQDILSLCAVMFSNTVDEDKAFPIVIEDQWYLMSPKIKWQESDIYICEHNHFDTASNSYSLCGGKYDSNGSLTKYYCNNYSDVQMISNHQRQGVKVTGDIQTYNRQGCETRTTYKYIPYSYHYSASDLYNMYYDDGYRTEYMDYDEYRRLWNEEEWDSDYDEWVYSGYIYLEETYCPGHYVAECFGHKDVDLYITVYDKDYAISHNLYPTASTSKTGKYSKYEDYLEEFLEDNGFKNDGNADWVERLYQNDWYETYGLAVYGGVGFHIGGTLSDADIDKILSGLSEQEVSIKQQAIVEFALQYVGKIPYYWGGKASSLDYDKNKFGSTIEADYKGRTQKGLDCSGFVQWVMSNNGIKVPGSTAGYSNYTTTRDHSQLKIGDIGFNNQPGAESNHVGIYAGTDENGNDLWIHCNSTAGNVSVNNYGGFKYYVNL